MTTLYTLFLLIAGASAMYGTWPTPPPVPCPNSMCAGHSDGNYNYEHPNNGKKDNYFIQCVGGIAYCQACWPTNMKFKKECNQCLYSMNDACHTTQTWAPVPTYTCPDECPSKGPNFKGNIRDSSQSKHYVACWNGVTVGCVNCPAGLEFNEEKNACLYEGKYYTKPL